jgi:hypothetical protein
VGVCRQQQLKVREETRQKIEESTILLQVQPASQPASQPARQTNVHTSALTPEWPPL